MRFTLSLFFVCWMLSLSAQHTLSGCVVDALTNEGLIAAAVTVEGYDLRTVTDIDGCFKISVPDSTARLVFTYVGYRKQSLRPGNRKTLTVRLKPASETLEEIVVIGYGVARKADVTGSVASVSRTPSASSFSRTPPARAARKESRTPTPTPTSTSTPTPTTAGQLTAGETNDFSKWDIWEDISQEDLVEFRDIWHFYPQHRYAVQLIHPGGKPAVDVRVSLRDPSGKECYVARTDNQGRAELWYGLNDAQATPRQNLQLVATTNGEAYRLPTSQDFAKGINAYELPLPCNAPAAVDVAFLVDATGSMGDEMRYLTSELTNVISRVDSSLRNATLRTAAVFYRDSAESYVTRHQDFVSDVDVTNAYFARQSASGGGDNPEAVDAGLTTAIDSLDWHENAAARLLFLVLDAPPHGAESNLKLLRETTLSAAAKGIRVIPVVCSGMTKDGEYLLRSIALATNGTYVFLTDDSGIGGKHLAPTTDSYKVEKLNDLLVRLITTFGTAADCGGNTPSAKVAPGNGDQRDELKVVAYPNPTAGPVNVKLTRGQGQLMVFDMSGKLLRRQQVRHKRNDINLSGLAAGSYVVRHTVDGKTGSQTVILTLAR